MRRRKFGWGPKLSSIPNFDGTATQVIEKLRFVSAVNGLSDLHLNDYAIPYEQIRLKGAYSRSVKEHIKRRFPKIGDAALVQSNRQSVSIDRFEKSSSERPMDNEKRTDDL